MIKLITLCVLFAGSVALALPQLPSAPTNPDHPGSKVYSYGVQQKNINCSGRNVSLFLPVSQDLQESFPVVVYGHGQALGLDSYQGTLEHLAKKGVIAIFPTYDSGFFDQDWIRMGRDYVNLTDCALQNIGTAANPSQVVFSGHSKGAYIASIAAGLSVKESLKVRPQAVVLFEAAGFNSDTLGYIEPSTALTVVFSDRDTIVDKKISDTIFSSAKSEHKQFILMKSYTTAQTATALNADHFWPVTKRSFVGGGPESALHYYGQWKWLIGAAMDLKMGGSNNNTYLYGDQASDKGIPGFTDEITRNF
jgi:hypothetical protein